MNKLKITIFNLKKVLIIGFQWILDIFIYVTWANVGITPGCIIFFFSMLGPFLYYILPKKTSQMTLIEMKNFSMIEINNKLQRSYFIPQFILKVYVSIIGFDGSRCWPLFIYWKKNRTTNLWVNGYKVIRSLIKFSLLEKHYQLNSCLLWMTNE